MYNKTIEIIGLIVTLFSVFCAFCVIMHGIGANNPYIALMGLGFVCCAFLLMPLTYKLAKTL